jgi:hypothetical protein
MSGDFKTIAVVEQQLMDSVRSEKNLNKLQIPQEN